MLVSRGNFKDRLHFLYFITSFFVVYTKYKLVWFYFSLFGVVSVIVYTRFPVIYNTRIYLIQRLN